MPKIIQKARVNGSSKVVLFWLIILALSTLTIHPARSTATTSQFNIGVIIIRNSIYDNPSIDHSLKKWCDIVEEDTNGRLNPKIYKTDVTELEQLVFNGTAQIWVYLGSIGDLLKGLPYYLTCAQTGEEYLIQPLGLAPEGRWGKWISGTLPRGVILSYLLIPDYFSTTLYTNETKIATAQSIIDNAISCHANPQKYDPTFAGRVLATIPGYYNGETIYKQLLNFSGNFNFSKVDVQTGANKKSTTAYKNPFGLTLAGHGAYFMIECFDRGTYLYDREVKNPIGPAFLETLGCEVTYIKVKVLNGTFLMLDKGWATVTRTVPLCLGESSWSALWNFWNCSEYLKQGYSVAEAILMAQTEHGTKEYVYGVLYGDPTLTFLTVNEVLSKQLEHHNFPP